MRFLQLPLLLGFLLGLRHAFEPDHLAAVAGFLGRRNGNREGGASRIGALWGAGHATSLLLAGSGVILLGWRIPPALQAGFEGAAALVLILMGGGILLRRLRGERAHLHLHEHDGLVHAHLHFHGKEERAHRHHPLEGLLSPLRRPFLVGMLHGVSGTGAAALLVLSAASSPAAAVGTLALFGVGALAGMAALSWLLGLPLSLASRHTAALHSGLRLTSGIASLFVGVMGVLQLIGAV